MEQIINKITDSFEKYAKQKKIVYDKKADRKRLNNTLCRNFDFLGDYTYINALRVFMKKQPFILEDVRVYDNGFIRVFFDNFIGAFVFKYDKIDNFINNFDKDLNKINFRCKCISKFLEKIDYHLSYLEIEKTKLINHINYMTSLYNENIRKDNNREMGDYILRGLKLNSSKLHRIVDEIKCGKKYCLHNYYFESMNDVYNYAKNNILTIYEGEVLNG